MKSTDYQVAGDHYKKLKIQPIEYIMANQLPFPEGCIVKYATRWRDKGGIDDLRKIKQFCDFIIESEIEKAKKVTLCRIPVGNKHLCQLYRSVSDLLRPLRI